MENFKRVNLTDRNLNRYEVDMLFFCLFFSEASLRPGKDPGDGQFL